MRMLAALVVALLLNATSAAQTLTLAWTPTPTPVDGYRLLVGTAPGTYTVTLDVGNVTQATIHDLLPGQHYYMAAVAYAGALVSGPSNEVDAVIPVLVDPACTFPLGAQAIAIFPTALQHTGSGGPGSQVRLDLQLASPASPITSLAIRAGGVDLATLRGTDLTRLAGIWFPVPVVPGVYPLSVVAANAYGCTKDQSTPYRVTVP